MWLCEIASICRISRFVIRCHSFPRLVCGCVVHFIYTHTHLHLHKCGEIVSPSSSWIDTIFFHVRVCVCACLREMCDCGCACVYFHLQVFPYPSWCRGRVVKPTSEEEDQLTNISYARQVMSCIVRKKEQIVIIIIIESLSDCCDCWCCARSGSQIAADDLCVRWLAGRASSWELMITTKLQFWVNDKVYLYQRA